MRLKACRRRLAVVATLLLAGTLPSLAPAPARAYILPADFLLQRIAEQHRRTHDLSVRLNAELITDDSNEVVEEWIYLKRPQRLRVVHGQQGDGPVYVEREGRAAAGHGSQLQARRPAPVSLLAALFVPGGRDATEMGERMLAALTEAGVDTTLVSLGRLDRQPVYIIGAKPWEPHKPQLWLLQDGFVPVRYVVHRTPASTDTRSPGRASTPHPVEIRLLYAAEATSPAPFPAVIETYVGGKLTKRSEVAQVQRNQRLPETLFGLPKS